MVEDEQISRIEKVSPFEKTVIIVSPDIEVPQVTGFLKAYIYIPQYQFLMLI